MAQESVTAVVEEVKRVTTSNRGLGGLLIPWVAAFGALSLGASVQASVDLSGTYDVATLTPLERPKMFGDKRFLTREEAAMTRVTPIVARHRLAVMVPLGLRGTSVATIPSGSTTAALHLSWMESSARPF